MILTSFMNGSIMLQIDFRNGRHSIVGLLSEKGLGNSPGEHSRTPLHLAVLSGSKETVEELLALNVIINKM